MKAMKFLLSARFLTDVSISMLLTALTITCEWYAPYGRKWAVGVGVTVAFLIGEEIASRRGPE